MKGRARCWSCVTLGLLVSGLIHAAAAGWWLRGWSPQAGPPATPPEAQIVELALAVFDEPLVQTQGSHADSLSGVHVVDACDRATAGTGAAGEADIRPLRRHSQLAFFSVDD